MSTRFASNGPTTTISSVSEPMIVAEAFPAGRSPRSVTVGTPTNCSSDGIVNRHVRWWELLASVGMSTRTCSVVVPPTVTGFGVASQYKTGTNSVKLLPLS